MIEDNPTCSDLDIVDQLNLKKKIYLYNHSDILLSGLSLDKSLGGRILIFEPQ